MNRVLRITATVCVAVLLFAGCNQEGPAIDSGTIPVVVSIPPQKWIVDQVGGQHVDVLVLVDAGDDPHSYQPTDAQISRVLRSAVYFRVGVPFENGPWFQAVRGTGKVEVVDASRGIERRQMAARLHHEPDEKPGHDAHAHDAHAHAHDAHAHAHDAHAHDAHAHGQHHSGRDPHVWTSPRLLKMQARTVAEVLGELAPEHREDLKRNLAALEARLDAADEAICEELGPYSGRAMVVFHPAWGYFADEYGLRQVAIEIEGKEPSDAELTELQEFARRERTAVIFVQPQISGQSAEAVARTVGARVELLDPLAEEPLAELRRAADILAEAYAVEGG